MPPIHDAFQHRPAFMPYFPIGYPALGLSVDVIEALARGEAVDPAAYYFRTTPRFETAHPAYVFLNHLITVASGDRRAEGPIYTIHELL